MNQSGQYRQHQGRTYYVKSRGELILEEGDVHLLDQETEPGDIGPDGLPVPVPLVGEPVDAWYPPVVDEPTSTATSKHWWARLRARR